MNQTCIETSRNFTMPQLDRFTQFTPCPIDSINSIDYQPYQPSGLESGPVGFLDHWPIHRAPGRIRPLQGAPETVKYVKGDGMELKWGKTKLWIVCELWIVKAMVIFSTLWAQFNSWLTSSYHIRLEKTWKKQVPSWKHQFHWVCDTIKLRWKEVFHQIHVTIFNHSGSVWELDTLIIPSLPPFARGNCQP